MRGGQIKLGGGGSLVGHGVTIFLMEGAEFTTNANETVDLSPPSSGDYAGITLYQEKADTLQLTITRTYSSSVLESSAMGRWCGHIGRPANSRRPAA
jgi:hypothetical protein